MLHLWHVMKAFGNPDAEGAIVELLQERSKVVGGKAQAKRDRVLLVIPEFRHQAEI